MQPGANLYHLLQDSEKRRNEHEQFNSNDKRILFLFQEHYFTVQTEISYNSRIIMFVMKKEYHNRTLHMPYMVCAIFLSIKT